MCKVQCGGALVVITSCPGFDFSAIACSCFSLFKIFGNDCGLQLIIITHTYQMYIHIEHIDQRSNAKC